MKGEPNEKMRTQTLELEVQREEHDYLLGLNPVVPYVEDAREVVSAPFAHPDNREYSGE